MQGPFLRKYGVEAKFNFQLFEVDGVDFRVDAVHASGDSVVMKNEGSEANTSNGFVDEGRGYSITLTATEMQAARIVVYVVDQTATKVWLDTAIVIDTYGNASAQHAFDLDTATQGVDVVQISGDSTAADNLESYCDGTTPQPVNATEIEGADATNQIGDAVADEVVEGALTLRQILRLLLAVMGGKSTGGGTGTIVFRDNADSKARVTATVDASNNRTAMTLDGS